MKGFGEQVVYILNRLAGRALTTKKFAFKKPRIEQVSQTHTDDVVQETGSVSSDDEPEIASEEEPEDLLMEQGFNQKDEDKMVIESKIDPKEWILECERAGQKLKIQIKHEGREWRNHFDQTKQYSEHIRKLLPDSRVKIERLTDELNDVLDRIQKKEKHINDSMNQQGHDYKTKNEEYKRVEAQYKNLNNSIKEMGEQFRQLTEKYENVQVRSVYDD